MLKKRTSDNRDIIWKYANRRLRFNGQFVTQQFIQDRIALNKPFSVIERNTNRDVTCEVLLSVLLQMEREGFGRISESELCRFIRKDPFADKTSANAA